MESVDKIIIGAGLYGLYSALFCAKKKENVVVLERDTEAFGRATYINQARVHMGYHYPRSLSTAIKSAGYFNRFVEDYGFCINDKFEQIYATSSKYSWTNAEAFRKFCKDANIKCEDIVPSKYFKKDTCDGAFLTMEYSYDAMQLKDYFLNELKKYPNVKIYYNSYISEIKRTAEFYDVIVNNTVWRSGFVLNATYASVNQIISLLNPKQMFDIKYELCEIILCNVSNILKDVGLTVMDGPFFSVMPFGNTGYHSLTSVTFTPHMTSYDKTPVFPCQNKEGVLCERGKHLGNCNNCVEKPKSSWKYMEHLARKYMNDDLEIYYEKSLFSMKPILKMSEVDDSRPTVIKYLSEYPTFVSVLSGKINTVYDLDEVLSKP